jgi:hypothetical protein
MTVTFQVEHRGDFSSKQDISQSVHSRSTSPGSNHSELPEYDYPMPIFVRNTFLNTPLVRPLSLDEFVQERRIKSCPLEALGSPDSEAQEEVSEQRSRFSRAATLSSTVLTAAANDAAFAASRAVSSFRDWWKPVESFSVPAGWLSPDSGYEAPTDFGGQSTSQIICLANALVEPELGSSELPTVGSAGHRWGICKPCAFLYKRGCENGVQCSFCHLCDSGEKKRRQKEKIALLKEMRASA